MTDVMTKLDEQTILTDAVAIAAKRIRAAAATKRLFDDEAVRPPRRLSAKAWLDGALRQAGHGPALIATLRTVLTTRAAQFPGVAAHTHAWTRAIVERESRGIPAEPVPAPEMWRGDKSSAESELALLGIPGLNAWSCACLAIDDLAKSDPEAFGDVDDPAEEQRQRVAVADAAAASLVTLASTPKVILQGIAIERGIPLSPESNLPERLREHEMAGSPRPAPGRPSPRPEGATLVIGRA